MLQRAGLAGGFVVAGFAVTFVVAVLEGSFVDLGSPVVSSNGVAGSFIERALR